MVAANRAHPMDFRRIAALWGVVALTLVLVAQGQPGRADVPVVFLEGRGHGHGVGLSQWGAEWMARSGRSWQDILAAFYPGTSLGQASGPVRVAVFSSLDGTTTLQFPTGGEVRSRLVGEQEDGFPVRVGAGGSVRIRFDGTYHVETLASGQSVERRRQQDDCIPFVNCPSATTTTSADPCVLCTTSTSTSPRSTTTTTRRDRAPTTEGSTATSSGGGSARTGSPVWAVPGGANAYTTVVDRGRGYRDLLEISAGAGPLRVINQVDIETYLRGMGEVPSTWPAHAVAAQTIAARTWALRAMRASGELCDHELCQVYIGVTREAPGQDAAIAATRGVVVTYGGALASTVYSASAGGTSATTFEGFGTPDGRYPYLKTVRYATDDPRAWRAVVALGDVASRLSYPGTVDAVRVTRKGPSGRALQVTVDGTAGRQSVDGREFAKRLGLRSTLFRPTLGTADQAPPPPTPSEGFDEQALPDDRAALKRAVRVVRPPRDVDGFDGVVGAVRPRPPTPDDVTDHPATRLGVLLLGAVTAVALSRFGLAPLPYRSPYRTTNRAS